MSRFQLILIGIFVVFTLVGVFVFSSYRGSSRNAVEVVVWGTIPALTFDDIIENTELYQNKLIKIFYIEKSEESFDSEFVEALASGNGPDLIMLTSDKIMKHRNKLLSIPYTVFSSRQFKDSFVEGAEVFMMKDGIVGMPIVVDPLVMYWNRSIFNNSQITEPPLYWDQFFDLSKKVSKKDGALNISKSFVSFGEYENINHAKDIVASLIMQAGSPISYEGDGKVSSVLSYSFNKPLIPSEAALNFYTEFSNPSKTSYSWNRALPDSKDYFLSGDLALYFGFASEIRELQARNPNLNFDVGSIPSSREGGTNVSFGKFTAFAISKSSKIQNQAYQVALILSGQNGSKSFSKLLKLPSVRRDLLSKAPETDYESVFWKSAIRSKTWLDPDPLRTEVVFKDMIQSITSGRLRVSEAVSNADNQLNRIFDSFNKKSQ